MYDRQRRFPFSRSRRLSRVAPLDRPVLLIGERGTGKELSAARVHFLSKRWSGPFVKLGRHRIVKYRLEGGGGAVTLNAR